MSNLFKPFLSDSVKKLTIINIIIFITLIVFFNSILIFFLNNVLRKDLDHRIEHEIKIIINNISFKDDSNFIIDSSIIYDPDFYYITDSPVFFQIYNSLNQILFSSKNLELYKNIPRPSYFTLNEIYFESINYKDQNYRAAYFPIFNQQKKQIAVLKVTVLDRIKSVLFDNLILFNLFTIPIALLLIIFLSFWGARRVLIPLDKIISIAQRINQNNLSERIKISTRSDDELGRLQDTLNELFDKIEKFINELKQFTDQVSHQLMNPLTAIKTEIEYILKNERANNEYKEALLRLEDQVESMISIVKTLLIIARSEKTKITSNFVFNFSSLLKKEIHNFFSNHHSDSKLNLTTQIEDELYLRGESEKFSMVLQNLFSNSKKFSIDTLDISVKAYKSNNYIILEVADKGIGIDNSEKSKVFGKFYRSEMAEKFGISGFGLGLNLVKNIVEEASGKIEILDNIPKGTIIKITLPALVLSD